MAEHAPKSHELQRNAHELDSAKEHHDRLQSKHEKEAKEASLSHANEKLEQAQRLIEKHAVSSEKSHLSQEHSQAHNAHRENDYSKHVDQEVSYSQTMVRVRKRLSSLEKPLSKVVHNKVVDTVSESVGKTVARPSSVLGGAFVALIGSSALLWITKHYGYEYNYLAVILLFCVGALLGITTEYLLKLRKKSP